MFHDFPPIKQTQRDSVQKILGFIPPDYEIQEAIELLIDKDISEIEMELTEVEEIVKTLKIALATRSST